MQGLYQLNATITHFLEGFLETAVPMIAGLAEVVGLFIIITSLAKASYHYVRATFFNGIRRAAGSHLRAARHDEPAAALGDGGRPPPGQCQGRRGWRKEITAKNICQTFAVQGTSTL